MSGKFGIKGGNFRAQNKQGGVVSVSTDVSGNGSSELSFRQNTKNATYGVQLTPLQSGSEIWTSGTLMAANRSTSGMKVYVRGCSETSSVVKISYEVFDDSFY